MEIDYTALNFSAPEQVRFKYRLEGHGDGDTRGRTPRDERVARYPQSAARPLPISTSSPAMRTTSGAIPTRQFWPSPCSRNSGRRGGFASAGIVFILGIVAAIVRYISTQKLQRQLQSLQQREALEHERARIARDLHDQLGANLTQVALLGEMAEADKDTPGGNRIARAADFPDRARNDPFAG